MVSTNRSYTAQWVAVVLLLLGDGAWLTLLVMRGSWSLWMVVAGALLVLLVGWVVKLVRFPLTLVQHFASGLKHGDVMLRFPETHDPALRKPCGAMNEVLRLHAAERNELEVKRTYYDRILRVMTHELRNTITPIISLTSDAMEHYEGYDDERKRECLAIVNEEATAINRFLDAYYQLTHLPEPRMAEVRVEALFDKLKRLLATEHGHCELHFVAPENMVLRADGHLLTLVLINLVRNAWEMLEGQDDGCIGVQASLSEGKPYITVHDNGPGIADEHLEHIFEPFYSSKPGGTGIGLCLAQQIMRLHGGELKVASCNKGNTTFMLTFG